MMAAKKVSCITSTTGECLTDIKIILNNKGIKKHLGLRLRAD